MKKIDIDVTMTLMVCFMSGEINSKFLDNEVYAFKHGIFFTGI
jgi:hypothetical protein